MVEDQTAPDVDGLRPSIYRDSTDDLLGCNRSLGRVRSSHGNRKGYRAHCNKSFQNQLQWTWAS